MNVRAPRRDDLDDVLSVLQAADVALIGESDWTAPDLEEEWEKADLERNGWLVELDGRLAGYALLDVRPESRLWADGYVHPELRGRGVGSELLRLTEARARELGATLLHNATLVGDPAAPALYEGRGYAPVRHFFRMVVDLDEEPAEPRLPEGVELGSYDHPREARALHATVEDAFANEWMHRRQTFEEFEERRLGSPRADTSLWQVVRADGEIVGASLNDWKRNGDWGWIGSVAVSDAWRRRGLGEALLQASFCEFHRRGERRVALGVDVQNPSGATRLYERVGMRVFWEAVVYEKKLDG